MKFTFTLLFLFLFFSVRSQSIVYVTQNGAGNQSGASWSDALPGTQLQNRLASASSSTQFWVAQGTYKPTTGTDRTISFFIPSGVQVYGGFSGSEGALTNRILGQPSSTTFTGEIGDPNTVGDNSYHVVTFNQVSASTRLDGVVITGGNGSDAGRRGGGVNNSLSYGQDKISSPTLANCRIENNDGGGIENYSYYGPQCHLTLLNCQLINNRSRIGGGINNIAGSTGKSTLTLTNCHFENNVATEFEGGAIRNDGFEFGSARLTLQNCRFVNNRSNSDGGGISSNVTSEADLSILDCYFIDNKAVGNGGAIYQSASFYGISRVSVTNCLFDHNSAQNGGALYNDAERGTNTPRFINCTFSNNTARGEGGALFSQFTQQDNGSCRPFLSNCIVYLNRAINDIPIRDDGSTTAFTYSNIQGGFAGTGNIDQDPLFVDAANGNYRLRAGSPSINTGDPNSTAATVSDKDLDGNARVAENRIDMGAYEFQVAAQTGSDISLNLRVDNRAPALNQPVTYFLTVTNNGPVTATNVVWQNRLPDNLLFAGGSAINVSNNVLSGQIGSLAAGASTTFTYQLQPTQAAQYINAAQIIASSQTDPDSQPNSGTGDGQDDAAIADFRTGAATGLVYASANTDQVPLAPVQSNQPTPDPIRADLSLAMAVANRSSKADEVVTISIQVNNAGGLTATGVASSLILPNGVSFVSGNGFTASGQNVTGNFGSVGAGSSATRTCQVRIATGGNILFKAEVVACDQADTDSQPNSGLNDGQDDVATADLRVSQ